MRTVVTAVPGPPLYGGVMDSVLNMRGDVNKVE
jgi:hypothetical protein